MDINKLIQEFLRDNKKFLIAYILFMLAYPVTSVILPKYYGQIVDDLKENKQPQFKLILILIIVTNSMYLIMDKIDTIFIPKLQAYVRVNIVKVILENYEDKFEEQELGVLISKIVKLPLIIRDLARSIRNYIVPIVLVLFLIIIRFMMIDKKLGALALTGILVGFSVLTPMFMNCLKISSDMDESTDSVHEDISELFENMLDIYSMNTTKKELQGLEGKQQEIIDRYKKTFNSTNTFRSVLTVFTIVVFIGIVIYGYQLYRRKEINMALMINVVVTSMYIINKLGSFSGEVPDLVFNLGSYIRIQSYLSKLNLKPPKKENFQAKKGEVVFTDVGIKYGEKEVLKNFNMIVKPRESVAIVGKIGSGKSSIVKSLLKLIPYSGYIMIDGVDISTLEPMTVRSQILYVRQNPLPFNRTLYENISYGNDKITEKDVEHIFSKYDLNTFFEHKLEDKVGKRGGKLSGGQRQMIFLLRILLNENPIVILDEPTSSLDEKSSKYVWKMLEDILKSRTVLLITHDTKLAKLADREVRIGK